MNRDITDDEIDTIIDILNKFQDIKSSLHVPFFGFDELFEHLEPRETALIMKMFQVRSGCDATSSLVENEYVTPGTDDHSYAFVRVHKDINKAFLEMSEALQDSMPERLYILSGYRSPAYQVLIYLRELYIADFNMDSAERVAKLPSHSEHSAYPFHAIDVSVIGLNGENGKNEISTSFEKTDAYRWLTIHGAEYGFTLSYPENNQKNTVFEPWHWLYSSST